MLDVIFDNPEGVSASGYLSPQIPPDMIFGVFAASLRIVLI